MELLASCRELILIGSLDFREFTESIFFIYHMGSLGLREDHHQTGSPREETLNSVTVFLRAFIQYAAEGGEMTWAPPCGIKEETQSWGSNVSLPGWGQFLHARTLLGNRALLLQLHSLCLHWSLQCSVSLPCQTRSCSRAKADLNHRTICKGIVKL